MIEVPEQHEKEEWEHTPALSSTPALSEEREANTSWEQVGDFGTSPPLNDCSEWPSPLHGRYALPEITRGELAAPHAQDACEAPSIPAEGATLDGTVKYLSAAIAARPV